MTPVFFSFLNNISPYLDDWRFLYVNINAHRVTKTYFCGQSLYYTKARIPCKPELHFFLFENTHFAPISSIKSCVYLQTIYMRIYKFDSFISCKHSGGYYSLGTSTFEPTSYSKSKCTCTSSSHSLESVLINKEH